MSRRTVTTATYSYVIAPDADVPVAQRMWSIVITQLLDELTGSAPDGALQLSCNNSTFTARVGSGGFAGLAGIPAKVTPLLATKNYPVTLSVTADGFVVDSKAVTIPANAAFPGVFTPLDLGVWPLHRDPVSIYGSVNLATATGPVPVAGASVTLSTLWRRVGQPPAALDVLTLNGALSAARPIAATVQQVSMIPVGGPYQLVAEAGPGSGAVLLSNTVGLGPGSVLGLDTGDPDRAEYATVASISGSVNPAQPATVALRLPLGLLHFALGSVVSVSPLPAGAVNTLGVDAIAGDLVLLVNQPLAGIATGSVVAINGGASPTEYRTASLFAVTTSALGNYRLPLLSRVAQLDLTANDGVHAAVTELVIPNYGDESNRVDFLLN
jgi:hypothetical protein